MPYGKGNPQLEEGFTQIANEILNALALTDLTGNECRCLFVLWRKTYGWVDTKGNRKKEDRISYSQFAEATGLQRGGLIRTLESLVDRHIVTKMIVNVPGKNLMAVWAFNKKYLEWNGYHEAKPVDYQTPLSFAPVAPTTPLPDQAVAPSAPVSFEVVQEEDKVVAHSVPEVVAHSVPTKETKKDITKEKESIKKEFCPFLEVLKTLGGWKLEPVEDSEWVTSFKGEFPGFDVATVNACKDWHSGRPIPKHKGVWKSRFRNWLLKSKTMAMMPVKLPPGKIASGEDIANSWNKD